MHIFSKANSTRVSILLSDCSMKFGCGENMGGCIRGNLGWGREQDWVGTYSTLRPNPNPFPEQPGLSLDLHQLFSWRRFK